MNILVADDDSTCRLVLQRLFGPYGHVFMASNGREAMEKFTRCFESGTLFDLVCLDVMMPEMDGHAVLREIRSFEEKNKIPAGKRTKIAIMTALDDKETVVNAIMAGCDAYLVKPLTRTQVVTRLRKIGLTM